MLQSKEQASNVPTSQLQTSVAATFEQHMKQSQSVVELGSVDVKEKKRFKFLDIIDNLSSVNGPDNDRLLPSQSIVSTVNFDSINLLKQN